MGSVIIMSGCSGSGKSSYWAKQSYDALQQGKQYASEVVSADHYFMQGDGRYHFDPSKLSEAHGECFKQYILALQAGEFRVVVDNTNTTSEEIAPYILGAQAFGYTSEIITIDPSSVYLKQYAERNTHGVSLQVIERQAYHIRNRKLPKWWNCKTVSSTF